MSLSSIFTSSSCLQSSLRRKLPDSTSDQCYHTWSICALSLLPLLGPTAITAALKGWWHYFLLKGEVAFCLPFPGRNYVECQKTKLLTLFLRSLNSAQPHLLVYNWMNLKGRVTSARSKNVTGNTTAKPQTPFLSSVCCATLFSPAGHSGARSPPSTYRLKCKWLLSHVFMYVN